MGYKIKTLEQYAIAYSKSNDLAKKEIDNLAYQFMKENNNRDIKAMKQIYHGLKEMFQ